MHQPRIRISVFLAGLALSLVLVTSVLSFWTLKKIHRQLSPPAAQNPSGTSPLLPGKQEISAARETELLNKIRLIVRQEIRQQLPVQHSSLSTTPQRQAQDTYPLIDRLAMNDLVTAKLDDFLSVGMIKEDEMETLLEEMAQLEPADRQVAFSRLVQAMNEGTLDAHF